MARIKFPRTVGFGAGLLALVLVVYSIVGILWGLWRPTMAATAVEGGGFAIDSSTNAQFQGFGSFVIATALMAGLISFGVFKFAKQRRGLGTLMYLGILAVLGAYVFWLVGGFIAPTVPDIESEVGSQIAWAPTFMPGLGLTAAPFISLLVYWSGLYLVVEDSNDDGTAANADRTPPVEVGQPVY